ncbi:MAG: hypothetical protein JW940_27900 [Polyangiaceae bacterium]|nr:hypothetical protein [Polyangiaceae bacterium]
MKRRASIASSALVVTGLVAIGCGGSEGPRVSGPGARAGASSAGEEAASAGIAEAALGGATGASERETGGNERPACETGRERCRCFDNGTCYGSLSCLSGYCVDTGEGGGGGSAGTTPGDQAGGGSPAGGNVQAGGGGIPSAEPAAGDGPGGVSGVTAGSGGAPPSAAGTGGSTDQGVSGNTAGGSGGAGGAAPAGTAGFAGSAGSPCLELLTTEAEFTQATASLTVVTEDFSEHADGGAVTDFAVDYGNNFYHHDEVTFESFATSDQAEPGTRSTDIVTLSGNGISSMIGSYTGFDGIAMHFASAQVAVGYSVTQAGTEGFSLTILDADGNAVAALAVPANGPYFAAVRSNCGAVIETLEVAPNRSETGEHHSQFWRLAWVTFAH